MILTIRVTATRSQFILMNKNSKAICSPTKIGREYLIYLSRKAILVLLLKPNFEPTNPNSVIFPFEEEETKFAVAYRALITNTKNNQI